jgi:putative ABC transport system permease protein
LSRRRALALLPLVCLYPAAFRRAWGDEMADTARALLARARRERGAAVAVRLYLRLLLDGVVGGIAERLGARRAAPPISPPPRLVPDRRASMLDGLARDVAGAWRSLHRSPGYALAVVVTLALGIGANAAIFSVVRGVLLGAAPYPEADRLLLLSETNVERGWTEAQVAPANFLDWQERARSFGGMAAFTDFLDDWVVAGSGAPERVRRMAVAGDLFGVLGRVPALGRSFRPEETWGEGSVAILSDEFWRRRLGGDPQVVGKAIRLNGRPHTVVGVMDEGFTFWSDRTDVWTPIGWDPADRAETWFRRAHWVRVVGRLAPGATPEAARQELAAIAADLERRYPETNRLMGTTARPLADWLVGDLRRPLLVLFAAVALVLLIACVNVAHLQLARAADRQGEHAVRGCLGASRWRLVRRSLVESLLLSLLGALFGVGLAVLGTRWLVRLGESYLARGGAVTVDAAVVGFAALLAVTTAVFSGLAPALRGSRLDLDRTLRAGGRGGESRSRMRGRQRLIAAELAFAVIVVVGALLLLRSLDALSRVDPGFEPIHVTTAAIMLPAASYPEQKDLASFYQRFARALASIPGVEEAALTRGLPLTGDGWSSDFAVEGRGREEFGIEVVHREVTSRYFAALGVPLLEGAWFTGTEDPEGNPVVLINETLARKHFPDESPIGKRLCFDRYPDESAYWRTIVGVVGDERQASMSRPPRPEIFAPLGQDTTRGVHAVVRSSLPPETLSPGLRTALASIDPDLPLSDLRPMTAVVAESMARERFLLVLFTLFGALAVVLASLGVYGVTAEAAAARRREIGLRLAVGARAREVVALMVRRQALAALVGVAAGLLGAIGLGRAMEGLLYGVGGTDPASFAAAVALLLAVGVLAAWLPARHVARLDPLIVLREE